MSKDRQHLRAGVGVTVIALLALTVWPIGIFGGEDDREPARARASGGAPTTPHSSTPPSTRRSVPTRGELLVLRQGRSRPAVEVIATLPPRAHYQVWIYNAGSEARFLGRSVAYTTHGFELFPRPLPLRTLTRYRYVGIFRHVRGKPQRRMEHEVVRGTMPTLGRPEPGTTIVGRTKLRPVRAG